MARLTDRIALITGASRGIGRAVAVRFAEEGAHPVLIARTQGALEELDDALRPLGVKATLVPGDLTEPGFIERVGAAVHERFGRLDILVGNAAMLGVLSPTGHVDPAVWDRVMALNVTANWRLIRAFDPLLRTSPSGRAVFVTSGASRVPVPYWGPYATSKAALDMLVRTYAAEIARTPVRVNLIDPGVVRTAMRAQAFPGENPDELPPPESVTGYFVELASAENARNGETVRTY